MDGGMAWCGSVEGFGTDPTNPIPTSPFTISPFHPHAQFMHISPPHNPNVRVVDHNPLAVKTHHISPPHTTQMSGLSDKPLTEYNAEVWRAQLAAFLQEVVGVGGPMGAFRTLSGTNG